MSVIDLEQAKLERGTHLTGNARCNACGHEWVSVTPVGVTDCLECPGCGLYRGCFKGNITSDIGETVFVCNCGCQSFYIRVRQDTERGDVLKTICHGCGEYHGEVMLLDPP